MDLTKTPVGQVLAERFAAAGLGSELVDCFRGYGIVTHTLTTPQDAPVSRQIEMLELITSHGVIGDHHSGDLRWVGLDDIFVHTIVGGRNRRMANWRQVRLVSLEESDAIAQALGLPNGCMPPGLQAEHLVVGNYDSFSGLPHGSELYFHDPATGHSRSASLRVMEPNRPHKQIHTNIVHYLEVQQADTPQLLYGNVAPGQYGLSAAVMTGGMIYPNDIMTVWEHN